MKSFKHFISGLTAILVVFLVGIGSVQAQDDVVDVVKNSEDHTVFADLIEETELDVLLKQEGPYTVLAPTDEAFEKLDQDVETLKENKEELQNIVVGHLYNNKIQSSEVEEAMDVSITKGDIEASNGTVHVIDEVLTE